MKRKLISLFILFLATAAFAQSSEKIRVGLLNGPTCIPAAYLVENAGTKYSFETFADPQALLPKMVKKEVDVGFMPLNVAAKVYNSGNKAILCCAVTGLGNIKIITTDKSIRSFTDLKGKTVYTAGQGATPEYMLRYLLTENKLTYSTDGKTADVKIDFSIPTAQIAAQMISGKIGYAAVPEPFATIAKMKSETVVSPLDFQKEYKEVSGSQNIYPLSVMVVRKDFAEENAVQLAAFLSDYQAAYEWTIKNPAGAGRLSEKHTLGLAAGVVAKAVPVSNYTFIPAAQAVSGAEELLSIFLKNEPASIGGKLPEREFYYEPKKEAVNEPKKQDE